MALIGMAEAAKRLNLGGTTAALGLLRRKNIELVSIHARAWAVEEAEVEKLRVEREAAGYAGRGRPPGTFKPESPRSKAHKITEPPAST